MVRHAGTGQPVWRGEVRLRRSDGYSRSARTAGDGSFRFGGLVAGEHVVSVSEPGFEGLTRKLWIAGEEAAELDLVEATGGEDAPGDWRHDEQE